MQIAAYEAVMQVAAACEGHYGSIAGGATAAATYSRGLFYPEDKLDIPDLEYAWGDVDVFASSKASAISITQDLLGQGYVLLPKFHAVWRRWRKFEMSSRWETHSIRLESRNGIEVNVIAKSVHGVPCREPGQVASSFDFGHLTTLFDLETMSWLDFRKSGIPTFEPGNRAEFDVQTRRVEDWTNGYFSLHIGMREPERYARNYLRGYTWLTKAKDTLATGYHVAALHYRDKDDPRERWVGENLYPRIAEAIEDDDFDELVKLGTIARNPQGIDLLMEELD